EFAVVVVDRRSCRCLGAGPVGCIGDANRARGHESQDGEAGEHTGGLHESLLVFSVKIDRTVFTSPATFGGVHSHACFLRGRMGEEGEGGRSAAAMDVRKARADHVAKKVLRAEKARGMFESVCNSAEVQLLLLQHWSRRQESNLYL